jgi:hypothetical protein
MTLLILLLCASPDVRRRCAKNPLPLVAGAFATALVLL